MYDRPNQNELLSAAIAHFETHVIPAIKADQRLYFQTLVAINVLKVAERELALGQTHFAAEWASLNKLEGEDAQLPSDLASAQAALEKRLSALCARVRAGDYDADPARTALYDHLVNSVRRSLEVANPKFLQALAMEDEG
jgi:hypothetical protein